ncbi:MAG: hypothetical protein JW863_05250 [Chitinispirillaceae bacterium]|nr:hypothetical protein [Chitinispirillaceae bacterium]
MRQSERKRRFNRSSRVVVSRSDTDGDVRFCFIPVLFRISERIPPMPIRETIVHCIEKK